MRNWGSTLVKYHPPGSLAGADRGRTRKQLGLMPEFVLLQRCSAILVANCSPPPNYLCSQIHEKKKNQTGCQIPYRHNKKLIDCNSYFPAYSYGLRRSNVSCGDGGKPTGLKGPSGLPKWAAETRLLPPLWQGYQSPQDVSPVWLSSTVRPASLPASNHHTLHWQPHKAPFVYAT